MYDSYRENSQREIKKLITKQKAAKSFAREKDVQCTELADDLRQEKQRTERLQKRTAELEAQLKALQEQMASAQRQQYVPEVHTTKPALSDHGALQSQRKETATAKATSTEQAPPTIVAPRAEGPGTKQDTLPTDERHQIEPHAGGNREPAKVPRRSRPGHIRAATEDDIWNQELNSSSHMLGRPSDKPPMSPKTGRAVTSGTDLTPLKSLSINALPTGLLTRRDSAQPSPPVNLDRFAKEPLVRQEVSRSKPDPGNEASPAPSSSLPQPSPEPVQEVRHSPKPITRDNVPLIDITDDLSMPVPASSPFQPSPLLSPPSMGAKKASYFDRTVPVKPTASPPAKENVAPPPKAAAPQAENVKPTDAWKAINAPNVGKRITSITDKQGKEVGLDRIEAAKARMAARGRVLS